MHEIARQLRASESLLAGRRAAAQPAERVLGEPGRPLEEPVRKAMERRFFRDFSHVRVHASQAASESAQLLGARAYTVGSRVVFGDRAYAPGDPDGRRLLAHEFAHVAQAEMSAGGNTAAAESDAERVATEVTTTSGPVRPAIGAPTGAVLRQDAGEAASGVPIREPAFRRFHLLDEQLRPPEEISDLEPLVMEPLHLTAFADPLVDLVAAELLRLLDQDKGTRAMAAIWPFVVSQVMSPKAKRPSEDAPAYLYAPDVVWLLSQLGPGKGKDDNQAAAAVRRKSEVLNQVFQKLLAARNENLAGSPVASGDPEREWDEKLHQTVRSYIDGGLEGYRQVREALLNSFGALAVGSEEAFTKINNYYEKKITAPTFLHSEVHVHPKMRDALKHTEKLLRDSEHPDLAEMSIHVEAINIRWNVNNPLQLSMHSFGAAIDIDAPRNPNVPRFPVAFVKDVTGVTVPVTAAGEVDFGKIADRIRFGDRDPALQTMEQLLDASRQLVSAFSDEDHLAMVMWGFVGRKAGIPHVPPSTLLEKARAARAEGGNVRWRYQDPKARLPKNAADGKAHDALADLIFPFEDAYTRPEPPGLFESRRAVLERLIQMADVFERSFVRGKGGKVKTDKAGQPERIKAEARAPAGEAALPQLVAHGFASLPLDLIAALRATEGGNLSWLGTSDHAKPDESTRDFMHFELKESPAELIKEELLQDWTASIKIGFQE